MQTDLRQFSSPSQYLIRRGGDGEGVDGATPLEFLQSGGNLTQHLAVLGEVQSLGEEEKCKKNKQLNGNSVTKVCDVDSLIIYMLHCCCLLLLLFIFYCLYLSLARSLNSYFSSESWESSWCTQFLHSVDVTSMSTSQIFLQLLATDLQRYKYVETLFT